MQLYAGEEPAVCFKDPVQEIPLGLGNDQEFPGSAVDLPYFGLRISGPPLRFPSENAASVSIDAFCVEKVDTPQKKFLGQSGQGTAPCLVLQGKEPSPVLERVRLISPSCRPRRPSRC